MVIYLNYLKTLFALSSVLAFVALSKAAPASAPAVAVPETAISDVAVGDDANRSRMQKIKNMYAFEGFVYSLGACKDQDGLLSDFQAMKSHGARNVITFEFCGDGTDASYYSTVISAAGNAGLNIIPLIWTLLLDSSQTLQNTAVPRMNAVVQAVLQNPGPVLAVAMGDEPLFDNDFGSPDNLASYINNMRSQFQNAGLDIPISISDMAYGWQSAGDTSSVQQAVDFYMINNFPYFSFDATTGGSDVAWNDFVNDMNYFEGIAQGKPLLVTQTGWPSNKDQYAPNSANIEVDVQSEQGYWGLLDGHCQDFFKQKNIGWMWRNWDDVVRGWGVLDANGQPKWNFHAQLTC